MVDGGFILCVCVGGVVYVYTCTIALVRTSFTSGPGILAGPHGKVDILMLVLGLVLG